MTALSNLSKYFFYVLSIFLFTSANAGPLGDPFRANTYTTGNQSIVDLSAGANGDMLVMWKDAGRSNNTFMQRYDSAGNRLQSDDWYIGDTTASAALDRYGNYVVVRTAYDGSGTGIYATVYNRNGSLRVSEFRVNDSTAGDQNGPVVAMSANGEFAISWINNNGTPSVYAKRFRANGTAVAYETLASNSYYGPQRTMGIAIDAAGNFAVTWYSQVPQSNQLDVWVRRFSASGAALGNQVRANTYSAGMQVGNQIAMNSRGDFIVVWESYGQASASWDIFAQRYNSAGTPIGAEFRVNTDLVGEQQLSDVGMLEDGSFVITWLSDNRWNNPSSIPNAFVRQFRSDGSAVGTETPVNTVPNTRALNPKLGMDAAGNFMIGWWHYDIASGDTDVFVRRYATDTVTITPLVNGQTVQPISGATGSWNYYKITVPPGATTLNINMAGPPAGDADWYLRYAGLPTSTTWDVRPYLTGNNEQQTITNIPPGDFYIGIQGYAAYSGVSLTVTYY